eukprot:Hpha_TRINITY_DN13614_c1_g1::TRINITY_DN13614_c1_g1_i1::g.122543::m.122543
MAENPLQPEPGPAPDPRVLQPKTETVPCPPLQPASAPGPIPGPSPLQAKPESAPQPDGHAAYPPLTRPGSLPPLPLPNLALKRSEVPGAVETDNTTTETDTGAVVMDEKVMDEKPPAEAQDAPFAGYSPRRNVGISTGCEKVWTWRRKMHSEGVRWFGEPHTGSSLHGSGMMMPGYPLARFLQGINATNLASARSFRDRVARELGDGEFYLSICWHLMDAEELRDCTPDGVSITVRGGGELVIPPADWPKLKRPLHYLLWRGSRQDWNKSDDDPAKIAQRRMAHELACAVARVLDEFWRSPQVEGRPFSTLAPPSGDKHTPLFLGELAASIAGPLLHSDLAGGCKQGLPEGWNNSALDAVLCAGQWDVLSAMFRSEGGKPAGVRIRHVPQGINSPLTPEREHTYEGENRSRVRRRSTVAQAADVEYEDLWLSDLGAGERVLDGYMNEYGRSLALPGWLEEDEEKQELVNCTEYARLPLPSEKEQWREDLLPHVPPGLDVAAVRETASSSTGDWIRQQGESIRNLVCRSRRMCLTQLILAGLNDPRYDRFGLLDYSSGLGTCLPRVFQRAPWVLHDEKIVLMLAQSLRALAGLVGGTPSEMEMTRLQEYNRVISVTDAPVLLTRRHTWRVQRFSQKPGTQGTVMATKLGLFHWACVLNCPSIMVVASDMHKMMSEVSPRFAAQLVKPWTALHQDHIDDVLCEGNAWFHKSEEHSVLWLACYSAALSQRPILRAQGFRGWTTLLGALQAGTSVGTEEKRPKSPKRRSRLDVVLNAIEMDSGDGDEDAPRTRLDLECTPAEVACQFGHSEVLVSLVDNGLLPSQGVALKNAEGLDAHDVTLLLRRRAEKQWSDVSCETFEIIDETLDTLQRQPSIRRKMGRLNHIFLCEAWPHLLFVLIVVILAFVQCGNYDGEIWWTEDGLRSLIAGTEYPPGYDLLDPQDSGRALWSESLMDVGEVNVVRTWFHYTLPGKILRPWTVYGNEGGDGYPTGPYGAWDVMDPLRVCRYTTSVECPIADRPYTEVLRQSGAKVRCSEDAGASVFSLHSYSSRHSYRLYDLQGNRECLLLRPTPNGTNANLTLVADTEWINHTASLVMLHVAFYNRQSDIFAVGEVGFEITPQGAVLPSLTVTAVRMHTFGDLSIAERFMWGTFCATICIFAIIEIHDVVDELSTASEGQRKAKKGGKCGNALRATLDFCRSWPLRDGNIVDLSVIALGVTVWVYFFMLLDRAETLKNELNVGEEHAKFHDIFVELCRLTDRVRYGLGLIVLLGLFSTTKFLRRLSSVGDVVHAILATFTTREVFTLCCLFALYLFAYWISLYTMFGNKVSGLRSPSSAFIVVIRMFLGDWGDEMNAALEIEHTLSAVIFVLMFVWVTMFFLNILIAVISEAYMRLYVPERYRTYMSREVYLPKKLLSPRECPSLGIFGVGVLRVIDRYQSTREFLRTGSAHKDPDWDMLLSPAGEQQYRHSIRRRQCSVGEVADISRHIVRLANKPPGIAAELNSLREFMDENFRHDRAERLALMQSIQSLRDQMGIPGSTPMHERQDSLRMLMTTPH